MSTEQYFLEKIQKTKLLIDTYEDAVDALLAGGVQQYVLDTGQSRQSVTKLDVVALQKTIDSLYNRLAVLQARLTGNGTAIGRPAW